MENRLEHLDEFNSIIWQYEVSKEGQAILNKTKLVLMLAPSSTGRNTLIKELLKTGEYHYIISDTTRRPRINNGVHEQNGVEYWFRTEAEMLEDLRAGKYLEAEVIHNQQVSGISIRELQQACDKNKYAVTDIDLKGLETVVAAKPDTVPLLILPPSFDEWQKRMNGRGVLNRQEKRRRLETAVRILTAGITHPYFKYIINDHFETSVGKVHKILTNGVVEADQISGKQLIHQLLEDTNSWLKKQIS